MDITNVRQFGWTDDTVCTPARLDRLRELGMPEEAIRPDHTIDLDVARRHGWIVADGWLLAPGQ
jgi:hypothetical protein